MRKLHFCDNTDHPNMTKLPNEIWCKTFKTTIEEQKFIMKALVFFWIGHNIVLKIYTILNAALKNKINRSISHLFLGPIDFTKNEKYIIVGMFSWWYRLFSHLALDSSVCSTINYCFCVTENNSSIIYILKLYLYIKAIHLFDNLTEELILFSNEGFRHLFFVFRTFYRINATHNRCIVLIRWRSIFRHTTWRFYRRGNRFNRKLKR